MDPVFTCMEPIQARSVQAPLLNQQLLHEGQIYTHPVTTKKEPRKTQKSLPN
jgi:hypothetical protein